MEKPIAVELHEADELIAIAKRKNVKFTIGYSQRFNPKYAYVKKCIDTGDHRQAGQRNGVASHPAQPRRQNHRPQQSSPRPRWKPHMTSTLSCGALLRRNRSESIPS